VTVTKRPRSAQTITGRYDRDQRMAGVKPVQFATRVLWHVRLVAVEAPLQSEAYSVATAADRVFCRAAMSFREVRELLEHLRRTCRPGLEGDLGPFSITST
jgi:hypothetical protein